MVSYMRKSLLNILVERMSKNWEEDNKTSITSCNKKADHKSMYIIISWPDFLIYIP